MPNIRKWIHFCNLPLIVSAAIGPSGLTGCGQSAQTDLATSGQALGGLPISATGVGQFVLLASGSITLGDRVKIASGDIGTAQPSGNPFALTVGFDDQISGDLFASATRLFDRASVGSVSTDQLTAPFAKFKALPPFASPPPVPAAGPLSSGAQSIAVPGGATQTLAPGSYAAVTVQGKLTLSGGEYDLASLTLGPDAAVTAAAASVLRIAGSLTASDRVTVAAAAGLGADGLRVVVGGTGGAAARFGNDDRVTALVLVPAGALIAADRFGFTGAAAAQAITVGNDATIDFNVGFGCSADAQCDDANACTQDACSAGFCTHAAAADGTSCDDGDACTQTDTCQAGACTGTNPVVCTASDDCHLAGACDTGSGQCSSSVAPDGTPCATGVCQAGACTATGVVIKYHQVGACDAFIDFFDPNAVVGVAPDNSMVVFGVESIDNSGGAQSFILDPLRLFVQQGAAKDTVDNGLFNNNGPDILQFGNTSLGVTTVPTGQDQILSPTQFAVVLVTTQPDAGATEASQTAYVLNYDPKPNDPPVTLVKTNAGRTSFPLTEDCRKITFF